MSSYSASRTVRLVNPEGLHLRAASQFVQVASRFVAEVNVIRQSQRVNGKSIWDLLALAAPQGEELVLEARGDDADQALASLDALIAAGFRDQQNGTGHEQ